MAKKQTEYRRRMRLAGNCVACGKKAEPIRKAGVIVGRRRNCKKHRLAEAKLRLASYHRTKKLTGRKKREKACVNPEG